MNPGRGAIIISSIINKIIITGPKPFADFISARTSSGFVRKYDIAFERNNIIEIIINSFRNDFLISFSANLYFAIDNSSLASSLIILILVFMRLIFFKQSPV